MLSQYIRVRNEDLDSGDDVIDKSNIEENQAYSVVYHGIRFFSKLLIIVPFRMVIVLITALFFSERSVDKDMVNRVFMRECTKILDPSMCQYVINPIFERIILHTRLGRNPEILEKNVQQESFERSGGVNTIWQTKGIKIPTKVRIRLLWYHKINPRFNPLSDPILIFYHGGGYAIKFQPSSFAFLERLHEQFSDMPIVVPDYSTTTTSDVNSDGHAHYPQQLFECLAAYDYLVEDLHCRNIILIGDSAGAHALLSILQYLGHCNRTIWPSRAVAISPWLNTTILSEQEWVLSRVSEPRDAICAEGAAMFGQLFVPGRHNGIHDHINDPYVNLEHNMEESVWTIVLNNTNLMLTYGDDEFLHMQIEQFALKLNSAGPDNFSLNSNVFAEPGGCHTGPVLTGYLSNQPSSEIESIKKIFNFIQK